MINFRLQKPTKRNWKCGKKSAGWCLPWELDSEHPRGARTNGGTQKKRLRKSIP